MFQTTVSIIVTLGLIAVFYILFPIWATMYAKKRGLKGLRIVAIVSIFILLGPIGGLIAWLGSANHPLIGQFQTKCPECGSEKVKAYLDSMDRKTGENLGSSFHTWMYFVFYFCMSALILTVAWGLYSEFYELAGFTGSGPAILAAIGGISLLWTGISKTVKYYQADRERLVKHDCKGCGKTWVLREDGVVFGGTSPA
jgi:predicted RNA-binding Zn-ribbon protein involved in translation (DUF1610 family)